jgi:hypothetical protein
MKYIKIEPEVIVGMGKNTIINNSIHPPVVSKLHINLEDWLGDDLMENFPVFIVTETLKNGLENSNFTGYKIQNLKLTKDENFEDNYQLDKKLPNFFWLVINGKKDINDFYIDETLSLNVSEKLFSFFKKYNLNNCVIDENSEINKEVNKIFEEFEKRKINNI